MNISSSAALHGIRATCVSRGWIATETDAAQPPSGSSSAQWEWPWSLLGRMDAPAQIAAAVLFPASEEASFITGQTLIVDGGRNVTDYSSMPFLKKAGANLFSGQL